MARKLRKKLPILIAKLPKQRSGMKIHSAHVPARDTSIER